MVVGKVMLREPYPVAVLSRTGDLRDARDRENIAC